MKKLMTLMLGLCLAFGTVSVFAQDTPPPKKEGSKGKSKGKGGKKKEETPKKEGSR